MKCPNCGRELLEGEICTCTSEQAVENKEEQAVNEVQPEVANAPVEAQEAEQQIEEPKYESTYYQPSEPAPQQGEYQNPYQEQSYNQPIYGAPQQNYYDPNQPPYYNPVMAKPEPSTDYPENYKPKKKYVAVILGASLGALGIHNFYLGNNGKATAQLLIALVGSLFFGLGLVVAEIWALVETVQILTDKIDADANNFKIMTFAEELAKAQNKE